jgi:hypothetical protein
MQVCFGVSYGELKLSKQLGYCNNASATDPTLHAGCNTDSDCGINNKCHKACITLNVHRCQYCVHDTETLSNVVSGGGGGFALDTNWLVSLSLSLSLHYSIPLKCMSVHSLLRMSRYNKRVTCMHTHAHIHS